MRIKFHIVGFLLVQKFTGKEDILSFYLFKVLPCFTIFFLLKYKKVYWVLFSFFWVLNLI